MSHKTGSGVSRPNNFWGIYDHVNRLRSSAKTFLGREVGGKRGAWILGRVIAELFLEAFVGPGSPGAEVSSRQDGVAEQRSKCCGPEEK